MPQFDVTTFEAQLFWLVVTFGAVYLFVARYAVPRLSHIVGERKQRISLRLEDVKRIHAECEEVLQLARQLRSEAHEQADKVRRKAAQEAEEEYRRAIDRARSDVDQMVAEANARIEQLEHDMRQRLQTSAVDVAGRMIAQATSIKVPAPKLQAAVEDRIAMSASD